MLQLSSLLIKTVCFTALLFTIPAVAEPNFHNRLSCVSNSEKLPSFKLFFATEPAWPAIYESFVGPAAVMAAGLRNDGKASGEIINDSSRLQGELSLTVDTTGDFGPFHLSLVGELHHMSGHAELDGDIIFIDCRKP